MHMIEEQIVYAKKGYKTKNLGYGANVHNGDTVADGTDHFVFKCKRHNRVMEVLQVLHKKEEEATKPSPLYHCLLFHLQCPDCVNDDEVKRQFPGVPIEPTHTMKIYVSIGPSDPHYQEMSRIQNLKREGIDFSER